jgi:LuxR family maltose regulon positive regulatory protein
VRVIEGGERAGAGAFAPVERPRLVERLSASAGCPITLLIAPAGYGKSVVLRQYLRSLREPHVRFALRGEHTTLLSFLRGFAEALRDYAPHAIDALAGAYERMTASPKRCVDLARWMQAHLESFDGVIAIDDLHVADADPDVAGFVCSLIERSKGRVRWIIASRSTRNLPTGTWLAYREAELAIGEEELHFTLEEARSAASGLGLARRDDELEDLLALTEGWPAAMSFALRTSTHSSHLRNVSALTREMTYRFLAEQVYSGLDEDERALLEVAIALPVINVSVLERAGFDRALPIVERLRERTAFIYEESPGIYGCHDLFRDFLRHQSALGGKQAQQQAHERAARALEASGDIEHAIAAYVLAGSPSDVVRLLERHGFDMLERARGDVVARAVESLDEQTRRQNATILALQGALQATAGKFARAESLLRRALAKAGTNRDLFAITSLRLASLLGNQGGEIGSVLDPVAKDQEQSAAHRAEAISLIVAGRAIAGETVAVRTRIAEIESLLPEIECDPTRAKILHHLGIANRHIGELDRAVQVLIQSSDLASELHLYSVVSRASAVLSNLALHEEDDVDQQLKYAELAADAATKAGDVFALRTALLQMLGAHMRRGDVSKSTEVEQRLAGIRVDDSARRYLALFRSVRYAWEGRFEEAHHLIASRWARMHFDFDRVSCGAHYALFLGLDARRDTSMRLVREVLEIASAVPDCGIFRARSLALSRTLCALAEFANQRFAYGERILRGISADDRVARCALEAVRVIGRAGHPQQQANTETIAENVRVLMQLGHGDAARLLTAAYERLRSNGDNVRSQPVLTKSEREVLGLLADGLAPKEIAIETARSVNTVQVHITNAIEKLGCHGQAQAVMAARQLGLI